MCAPDTVELLSELQVVELLALAALTINDPVMQPGFEEADTSVVAAMPLYGDYDWLDTSGERARRGLDRSKYIADKILKCAADTDRDLWEQGSPLYHVRADAPPFFVVMVPGTPCSWSRTHATS